MVLTAEAVARYCLLRILLNPDLLRQYAHEAAMDAFWTMSVAERQALWGEPMDLVSVRAGYRSWECCAIERHAHGRVRPFYNSKLLRGKYLAETGWNLFISTQDS